MTKKKATKKQVKRDSKGRIMINWVDSSELESQPEGRVGFRRYLKLKYMRSVAEMATFADVDFENDPSAALDVFGRIGTVMSRIIIAWNWTDEDSEPLPQPKDNPAVFEELMLDELMWLVDKMGQAVGSKN